MALLGEHAGVAVEWLDQRFEELSQVLGALSVIGGLPEEVLQRVQGLGEVYSARLLGEHLRALGEDCAVLDARDVLVVSHGELGVDVDWDASAQRPGPLAPGQPAAPRRGHRLRRPRRAGPDHHPSRNGSDYSGAIFAALFDADELHIWTDVDGVLSADPRVVPEAVQLESLSYDEACELAYFGAKVVHPQTMSPAIERGLPIIIRNTFHPDHPGTRITAERDFSGPVKGLTLSPDLQRGERRRHRPDRRAGHRRARVRRTAQRQGVGGDDLAGLLGAFDLLRGQAGGRRSRAGHPGQRVRARTDRW